jgi:hypothetical protein
MNGKFAIHACLLGGMLLTGAATKANADVWNKKTYINTSRSIEVPGAILPPGRYVFKLLDSPSNRHIVQILNDRENHVYTTNLAIPKQRMEPADKTILDFYEMPGGGPEPVRSWFYPGDTIGQEFAYPRSRALEIARVMREHVPILAESRDTRVETPGPVETSAPAATSTETSSATYENSADRIVEPAETAEPTPAAEPAVTSEATASMPDEEPQGAAPPATSSTPEPDMPHTAGTTAGIALIGLSCLGIAASLRMANNAAGNKS